MKRLFSLFLFIVMMTNVAVSLVEQLHGRGAWFEMTEWGTDDMDEKEKTEKEKESYTFPHHSIVGMGVPVPKNTKNLLVFYNERLRSELHAFSPDLPPEA
jgi:hypothetical protein